MAADHNLRLLKFQRVGQQLMASSVEFHDVFMRLVRERIEHRFHHLSVLVRPGLVALLESAIRNILFSGL